MERELHESRTEPAELDLDRYVSYDESGTTIICDRQNAAAWIRSSVTVPLER